MDKDGVEDGGTWERRVGEGAIWLEPKDIRAPSQEVISQAGPAGVSFGRRLAEPSKAGMALYSLQKSI